MILRLFHSFCFLYNSVACNCHCISMRRTFDFMKPSGLAICANVEVLNWHKNLWADLSSIDLFASSIVQHSLAAEVYGCVSESFLHICCEGFQMHGCMSGGCCICLEVTLD